NLKALTPTPVQVSNEPIQNVDLSVNDDGSFEVFWTSVTGSFAVGNTATLTSYYESFEANGTPKSAPQPIDAASQTSGQQGRETYSGHLGLAAAFSANGSLAYAYSDLTGLSTGLARPFTSLLSPYTTLFRSNLKALTPTPVQVSNEPIQNVDLSV